MKQLNEGLRDLVSHMEVENQQKSKGSKPGNVSHKGTRDKQVGACFTASTNRPSKENTEVKCRFCGSGHKDYVLSMAAATNESNDSEN